MAQYAASNPAEPDSDGEQRGLDVELEDRGGPIDVGMDAFVPVAIFRDGFEDTGLVPVR